MLDWQNVPDAFAFFLLFQKIHFLCKRRKVKQITLRREFIEQTMLLLNITVTRERCYAVLDIS